MGSQLELQLRELTDKYSACDISDALLKLKVPGAGFLPDILPLSSFVQQPNDNTRQNPSCFAAPISTILFVPKSHTHAETSSSADSNIPAGTHWTDLPAENTISMIQQPAGQSCAVVGDILARRLKYRGVKGIIVDGRIRDLATMVGEVVGAVETEAEERRGEDEGADGGKEGRNDGFRIWSRGTSTVGSGLQAKAWASDVVLRIGEVAVSPGDVLFADEVERGVVVIPHDKLDELLAILPGIKAADDAVVADIKAGVGVQEAFKKHRGT